MTLSFTTPHRFIPTHHKADPRPSTFDRKDGDHDSSWWRITARSKISRHRRSSKTTRSTTLNQQLDTWTNSFTDSYALEIKDPELAQVVQRVEAGELTIDHLHLE
jgi:hypothetical protein